MTTTGKKITDFTSLTSIADSDIMLAVDVSDTTSSPEGTTKKVLFSEVKGDITSGLNISNWDTAYGWGNHATAGYQTNFTETDPVFTAHVASDITATKIGQWDSAYGWGDHASAGYMPGFSNHVSYTSPVNNDQIAILDASSNTVKKVSLEDLIAKRARDSRRIYLSKDVKASDSNNGTSPEEPLLTFAAAIAAAEPGDVIEVSPGTYTEASLPLRVPRDVGIFAKSLRQVKIQPAAGQEMNGFFKVDSGFWCWGLEFAGHQADLANDQQSWAISFDDQADNTAAPLNASGLGAFILKSPYVQNCSSVTAEDDAGTAGSVSVGDTGGGIEVDGDKCAANSPIRSMVVDSYTQVNLGGPGCLVRSDGYAQLVSFFGTFCTFHVKTETGGQANLSGGGTTDFGDQGLVADGYSRLPNFTGSARVAAYGADRAEAPVVIDPSLDTFTTSSAHTLVANDQVTFSATDGTLPTGVTVGTTYYVIASGLTATVFKVSATEGGSSIDVTGSATGTYQFVRQGQLTADVISFTANRIGSQSRPNPGQLMFPRQTFPSAGQPGSAGNAVGVTAGTGSTFTVILNTFSYSHEYVSGGTVTVGGTSYNIATASYDHTTGITTLTATGYTPTTGDSAVLSGLDFICPTHGVYTITGSVPIDASGNAVAVDSPSLAGYRLNFYNTINGGLRSPIAASQVIDFRLRSQISCALHTMEYVGSGTNYNALPWNGGVPIAANQRVELNNGRVFGATINEKGDFEIGDGTFSIDGTTGSATINTSEFNISGLNFVGPFSRNGGFSTVGVQLREVSDNTSLIASTGAPDGNTVPTQNAVKDYVDTTTVQSVDLSAPTGFTSAGGPITTSGTITLGYDTGYQGYLTTESTKLAGIEADATADQTDSEIKVAYENNADTNAFTDAEQTKLAGIEADATADQTDAEIKVAYENNSDTNAFTDAEQTKLAGIEAGAQVNVAADLSYTSNTRVLSSSTGTDATLPLAVAAGDAGLLTGADKTQLDNLSTNLAGKANLSGGKLAISELPDLAITEFKGVVANQTAMLAITGEKGDWVTRSDDGKVYLITGDDPTQVGSWTALSYPASPVLSVNTQTGTVVLDADDISDASTTNKFTTAAEATKLAGIEAGATADQTDSEIKVAYENNADTNAFTDAEQTKLSGIAAGAEVNVATDLTYTASTRTVASSTGTDAVITEVVAAGDSGLMTGADKTKLDGVAAGAEVNVNADWNATTGDAFIENKPTIPAAYTDSNVDTHLNTSTASSNEVLSWTGSDYDWVAQSGGGGGLTNFTESQSTLSNSVKLASITSGGTGYSLNSTITPATTSGSGTGFSFKVTGVTGGVITAIEIKDAGSGYAASDTVTDSGGGNAIVTISSVVTSTDNQLSATGTESDINLILKPKGNGSLSLNAADGTTTGGNKRGIQAVDLQLARSYSTGDMVASGNFSALLGGARNKAKGTYSAVVGGSYSSAGSSGDFIGGGYFNLATGSNSLIGGGQYNTTSGGNGGVFGISNTVSAGECFAAGYYNVLSSGRTVVLGTSSIASGYQSMAFGTKANTQGIKGLHAIAPIATASSTYKNPQFYKVILTAVTPEGTGDSARRFLTTTGGSVTDNNATDSITNSLYIGRADGTNSRHMYVEGIVKASEVGGGNNAEYGVWEISGFIRGTGGFHNPTVTQKINTDGYDAPDITSYGGSSGSGTSTEYWVRLTVNGSNDASLLWTAYLTCYVTDEP